MRRGTAVVSVPLLLVALTGWGKAQDTSTGPATSTDTTIIARTGLHDKSAYHYLELIQTRGRWVLPDVGYIDFGHPGSYREFWAGGGAVLHASPSGFFVAEGLVTAATGPAAGGAVYFLPWFQYVRHLSPRVRGEAVYFVYLPLNEGGFFQHLLERAKLEYDLGRIKVGAGYSGYYFADRTWQHRPFLTTTFKLGRAGALELWLQRIPGSGRPLRTHLRYSVNIRH